MTEQYEGIVNPPIDSLLERVDSKYALVLFAAKRARQINAYYSQLHEGLFEYVGPLVDTQLNEKPLSIAFREIDEGLIEADHVTNGGFTPNGQLVSDEPTATEMFTGDFFAQGEDAGSAAVVSVGVQVAEEQHPEGTETVTETVAEEATEDSTEPTEQ